MAYTPVPAVAANDWIDEIFINTYWVDNMAASVPDVFSAKGQLPVGLGVDSMGVLNVGTDGTALFADSSQTLGVIWKALLNARQGGSSTDWSVAGTNNYTPATVKIEAGMATMTFSASTSANVVVTFPNAFAKVPLVLVTAQYDTIAVHTYLYPRFATVSQFTCYGGTSGSVSGNLTFSWLAVGE